MNRHPESTKPAVGAAGFEGSKAEQLTGRSVATAQPVRKPLLPFDGSKIPEALKAQRRWAPWRAEWNEKRAKWDKIPHSASAPDYGLSTAKPDRWFSYAEALTAFEKGAGRFAGIGYVMTGPHGTIGTDLDNCVKEGVIDPWAAEVVARLNSYTEISPSGNGLRIITLGSITGDWNNHEVGIEVYGGHAPRFLTITGAHVADTPLDARAVAGDVMEALAVQYARARKKAEVIDLAIPDVMEDFVLPDVSSLPLNDKALKFLTTGECSGDRSGALHAAGVALYAVGLSDDFVFSILANNDFAMGVALDHRGQDHDRALNYLWREHCEKAKSKVSVASLDDFDVVELSAEDAAESEKVRLRNKERAERIAQAAIDKAMAPTLPDIIRLIEDSDLTCPSASQLAADVISELVKARLGSIDEETALKQLKETTGFSLKALRSELTKARRRGPSDDQAEVSVEWPVPTARAFLQESYTRGRETTLRHWQDDFLVWDGVRYQTVSMADVRAELYTLFERHRVELPGRGPVDNTLDALKALANVPSTQTMPGWLTNTPPAPAGELIAVRNGLLHVLTREIYPHDPRFFSSGSVAVDYSPQALPPKHWLAFLTAAFPDDQESIDTLQQWFGYLLTQDTTQQKALICMGPKRCGKGTIARVLRALLGDHNCAGPTLGQLSHRFGLQGLLGKSLAIISDARVGGAADLQAISENLLRITGEDAISVERKNTTDWVGRMTTRFVLMTNILPGIVDAGGAVASRFIVLRFTKSFFGQEDTKLTEKLMGELPGILNWALQGLTLLQDKGAFIQPVSGREAVEDLIRKTTPILGFVDDVLAYDQDCWVLKETLYSHYRQWCQEEGLRFTLPRHTFFSELYANTDGRLTTCSPRVGGKQVNAVRGAKFAGVWSDRAGDFD